MKVTLLAAILWCFASPSQLCCSADTPDPPPDDPAAVAALEQMGAGLVFDDAGHLVSLAPPRDRASAALPYLAGVPRLLVLDLNGSNVCNRDLKHLSATPGLQILRLRDTAITDRGLKHVARMRLLDTLDLTRTRVTSAGLARLAGLSKLRQLMLQGTRVDDACAEELANLKRLKIVDVTETDVHEDAVVQLRRALPTVAVAFVTDEERALQVLRQRNVAHEFDENGRLHTISFRDGQWDTDVAEALSRLDHLNQLYLTQCGVTDEHLPHVAKIRSLESLTLNGNPISDSGALHLAALDRLILLQLANTDVTETCRRFLNEQIRSRLRREVGPLSEDDLRRRLPPLPLDPDALDPVERLVQLDRELGPVARPIKARRSGFHVEEFRLDGKNRIGVVGSRASDEQLAEIAQIEDLAWLALPDSRVTDKGLGVLSGLKTLRELNLQSEHVTDAGLLAIGELTELVYVTLDCPQVGDGGIEFMRRQENLRSIFLRSDRITDAGLSKLASLRHLAYVHICSTSITEAGRERLREFLPDVAIALSRDVFIGSPHRLHEPAK